MAFASSNGSGMFTKAYEQLCLGAYDFTAISGISPPTALQIILVTGTNGAAIDPDAENVGSVLSTMGAEYGAVTGYSRMDVPALSVTMDHPNDRLKIEPTSKPMEITYPGLVKNSPSADAIIGTLFAYQVGGAPADGSDVPVFWYAGNAGDNGNGQNYVLSWADVLTTLAVSTA